MSHMRNSGLRARARLAICAICVALVTLGAIGARTWAADPQVAIIESVQPMLDAQGRDWLVAREAFLRRPEQVRAAALEYLARADATKEEKTLALILRTRIERPDDVAAYERGVEKDFTEPGLSRSGRPIYGRAWPPTTSENFGLVVEHLWKRSDLLEEMRTHPYGSMLTKISDVDSLLVLLERDPDRSATLVRVLSDIPGAGDDARVLAALLAAYHYARTKVPPDAGAAEVVMIHTADFGTAPARDAVLQMHAFEMQLMAELGRAADADLIAAKAACRAENRAHRWVLEQYFAEERQREPQLKDAKKRESAAFARLSEILLWQSLVAAYQRERDAPSVPAPEQ